MTRRSDGAARRAPTRLAAARRPNLLVTADGAATCVPAADLRVDRDVRGELARHGWAAHPGADMLRSATALAGLRALQRDLDDLPADPYARGDLRRRRHSRLVHLPWSDSFVEQPGSQYYQSREHNPVDGGAVRDFAPRLARTLRSPLLLDLIRLDLALVPFPAAALAGPIDVGLHLIAYRPRPGLPAISTPGCFHRDGEPYTFVHLIARRDVEGGENRVATADERVLAEFTLVDDLDTFVVRDAAVVHDVREVRVLPGRDAGLRAVLLVDFTPHARDAERPW
jgi:hypothetical protein